MKSVQTVGQIVLQPPEKTFLVYDEKLTEVSPDFARWVRGFPLRYAVPSGERLKDLNAFPQRFSAMAEIADAVSPRALTVVSIGGGSVGDFVGFFASVYKRGVRLVHIPTTWLAAIDSSHGGKTALNNGRIKNQLGTFYSASDVILCESLLRSQPEERVRDAFGELGKIAIIDGGEWVQKLEASTLSGADLIWKFLKPAIASKMKVVDRDPLERTGERQILNLGHTIGHVLEAKYGWSHGESVAQGIFGALSLSETAGFIKPSAKARIDRLLQDRLDLHENPLPKNERISRTEFQSLLLKDKKKTGSGEVVFLVPIRMGLVKRMSLSVEQITKAAVSCGWVRA